MKSKIRFQELSSTATEFLHELNDPDLVRAPNLAPAVVSLLRREQVEKLQQNIELLRRKQEEFNSRMEEYISNLRRLVESLQKKAAEEGALPPRRPPGYAAGTVVNCSRCGCEERFSGLTVIFARESSDALDRPTQCYVSDEGKIKKGIFRCESCGSDALVIRSQ